MNSFDYTMAKQLTIKEISKKAGVSAGTVDRVLHNRGKVSAANLAKVQAVLDDVGYRNNIHTSAIALKKAFRIAITVPYHNDGGYWARINDGFNQALEEYSDVSMDIEWFQYDQFDENTCREQFDKIIESHPDAVIIGPTFEDETASLCTRLESESIPYAFVDSIPSGTNPVNAFTTDQPAGGYLLGKMMDGFTPDGSEMAILRTVRIGSESYNSQARLKGIKEYLATSGRSSKEILFSMKDDALNRHEVKNFLDENPNVKGIAVMNSRGYMLADILKSIGRTDVVIGGFDLTADNARCLSDGSISVLLCQRPAMQGFHALRSLLSFLLYRNKKENSFITMPIDILLKENLPYYKDSADL